MIYPLELSCKQGGDLVHPHAVETVLLSEVITKHGRSGKRHRSLDNDGRSLPKTLGFGIVEANRNNAGTWVPRRVGFSNSSQQDSCRSGPNASNIGTAVR